jgi:V8-like Glu-specific endopeptidase
VVHSDYFLNENSENNLAIINAVSFCLNENILDYFLRIFFNQGILGSNFLRRTLDTSEIAVDRNGIFYGWGATSDKNPRNTSVVLNRAQSCDPKFLQVYCSTHSSHTDDVCSAREGSLVVREDTGIVLGILLNNQSCSTNGDKIQLNYHSLAQQAPWIFYTADIDFVDTRFSVDVLHFTTSLNEGTPRCIGTIISENKVLTTASCVLVESGTNIGVRTFSGITQNRLKAKSVFVHPKYLKNRSDSVNVAVIEIAEQFSDLFQILPLGNLQTNSTCRLYGWSGYFSVIKQDLVTVYGSKYCDSNSPEIYCSKFSSSTEIACKSQLGAPIVCGNETNISGFVINNGSCNQNRLNFLSVDDLKDFINDPENYTDSATLQKVSIVFILSISSFLYFAQ